ncbi:MAG: stalk domain-containing protein [Paenibacillaceae bacterium]
MSLMRLKGVFVLLLLLTVYPATYSVQANELAASAPSTPIVILDGRTMSFDVAPLIIKGTTLVPMRAIFEELGANITTWSPTTQTVTAQRNQTEFMYTIGETYVIINGWKVNISSAPGMTKDYRTLIPLRMVSESLGAEVDYDNTTKTITINSKKLLPDLTEAAPLLGRYRITLPYSTMLQDAPHAISYLRVNHDPDSYVFFGDSLTWGSYLGRKETHPYLIGEATGRSSYNQGVPGFTMNQILPYMKYALQGIVEPNIVVQLQYFWGESNADQFTGLLEVIDRSVPDYSDSLAYIRNDMVRDDDIISRAYANYLEQPAILKAARLERSKQIFTPKTSLDMKLSSRLSELSEYIATRPDQAFYLYIPPYQMNEVFKYTKLTSSEFDGYIHHIEAIFAGNLNVQFKDFNSVTEQWAATDYIDWIHRSVSGEKKFAKHMQAWLLEDNIE